METDRDMVAKRTINFVSYVVYERQILQAAFCPYNTFEIFDHRSIRLHRFTSLASVRHYRPSFQTPLVLYRADIGHDLTQTESARPLIRLNIPLHLSIGHDLTVGSPSDSDGVYWTTLS